MPHEVETLAYAGETPWHGLGQAVADNLSPVEMQQAARLDWLVRKVPLTYNHDGSEHETGHYALVRTSDGKFLDTVKSRHWTPVQNYEAFEFFDDFVKAGRMTMEVAGSLSDGKRVFALAKVGHGFGLSRAAQDRTESYLLFTNPHLYGQCVDIRLTPVRVVCHNTLSLALGQRNSEYRVSFAHWRKFDPAVARSLLDVASVKLDAYRDKADFLSGKRYTGGALASYFREVFKPLVPPRNRPEGTPVLTTNAELALKVVETQPGYQFAPGTWWNAFNAVTYLTDHEIGRGPATRLGSAWYGAGKTRKIQALDLAMEFAKAS